MLTGGFMKRPTKIIITICVFSIVAVSTIILASNMNRVEPITITNQGVNMSNHPEAKTVTQDKEGHLTFAP